MPDSTAGPRSPVLRRSFRKDFPAAVRGEGVYLWDAVGKKYLDFSGSAAVNLIGHGVLEISAAMAAQAAKLEFVHTSQFTTPVAEDYAQELLAFAGWPILSRFLRKGGITPGPPFLARVPQAFDLAVISITVGGPSFRVLCERVGLRRQT